MKIAIHGLGRMGGQIARKLAEGGHEVIAHNRGKEPIDEATKYGAIAAYAKSSVLSAFENQRFMLWLMLPSEVVDSELEEWLKIAPVGSLFIDGGNSDFRQTKIRAQSVAKKGSSLMDIGVSGGIWGYPNGFSMMVGGAKDDFEAIEPALKTLAVPKGAYGHFGARGAGHFVKMVHNAIEYGMMESLAEGYRILQEGPYENLDLAAAGNVWHHGSVVNSWLNELSKEALAENPKLEGIDGVVAESGETRWMLETARELNIELPAIEAAFKVRLQSQKGDINFATKLLAAMRNKFGGHDINPGK